MLARYQRRFSIFKKNGTIPFSLLRRAFTAAQDSVVFFSMFSSGQRCGLIFAQPDVNANDFSKGGKAMTYRHDYSETRG
jgi:hypothetical protein